MIKFSFSGKSHGEGYWGTISGIPQGVTVNVQYVNDVLNIRKSGVGRSSRQTFVDRVIFDGHQGEQCFVTDGNDIKFFVPNAKVESRPNITAVRSGHTDLVGVARYPQMTARDVAEISSARSSLCYVVLGCICQQILQKMGIFTNYYIEQIADVCVDKTLVYEASLMQDYFDILHCPDEVATEKMVQKINDARQKGDSLGGIVCVKATGVPMGIGEIFPYHQHLDAQISAHVMGIPSVKGISFGLGHDFALTSGVSAHDKLQAKNGKVVYQTNNCGGIVGGVTNGCDVVFRLVVKPVPTVKGVTTVDTQTLCEVDQHFERADTCVVPTVGLVASHVLNYVLANQILKQKSE